MNALTRQFLVWVTSGPRSYADAMEAWRTSCPRQSIWEDAVRDRLVTIERAGDGSMKQANVMITARGRRLLARSQASAPRLTGSETKPRNRARRLRTGSSSGA
jgi:hypothetical protein